MSQNYIYRALSALELYTNSIKSKSYFDSSPLFGLYMLDNKFGYDALDTVENHISKGCKLRTPWISCTKDFSIAKKYANEDIDGKHNKKYNNGIALIKNHGQNTLESVKILKIINSVNINNLNSEDLFKLRSEIRNIKFQEIKKLVFDFSTGNSELFEVFIKNGLVLNSYYQTVLRIGRITHNYSKSSKEVIVLSEIPNSECYICSPLVLDMIDYLCQKKVIVDKSQIDDDFLNNIIADLKIYFFLFATDEKYKNEDFLGPVLLNTYTLLPLELKNLLVNLYINLYDKKNYCMNNNITLEELYAELYILFESIIANSEFLSNLNQNTNGHNSTLNLTFC